MTGNRSKSSVGKSRKTAVMAEATKGWVKTHFASVEWESVDVAMLHHVT